jgi:hypothetical protein
MPTKDEIKNFSMMVEELATKLRCNRMDAILQHCKETGLEVEVASTLISAALKAKIKDYHLIKSSELEISGESEVFISNLKNIIPKKINFR